MLVTDKVNVRSTFGLGVLCFLLLLFLDIGTSKAISKQRKWISVISSFPSSTWHTHYCSLTPLSEARENVEKASSSTSQVFIHMTRGRLDLIRYLCMPSINWMDMDVWSMDERTMGIHSKCARARLLNHPAFLAGPVARVRLPRDTGRSGSAASEVKESGS